jgi:hypothetical protein
MDYPERLAERMQLQLMRAELARARSDVQESRRCSRNLVIRSRDVSRAIAFGQVAAARIADEARSAAAGVARRRARLAARL